LTDLNNTTSTIDFSKFSPSELSAAFSRINSDKFPANYEACRTEIEKRKAEGRWLDGVATGTNETDKRSQFSVKRRYFSYLLDGIFIALFSLAFFPASGILNQIGLWGVIPFWFLNFAYGTLLDGPVGKGQTFGKKITDLKVIGRNGAVLSWSQASIRGAYLGVLVGIRFGLFGFFPESIFQKIFDSLLFTFYAVDMLFIFKHPQNRSIIDLATDTLIQDIDSPAPEFIGFSAVSKFKGWLVGTILVIAAFSGYGMFVSSFTPELNVDAYRAEIESNTHLKYTGVGTFKNYNNGQLSAFGTDYIFWLSPEYLSDPNTVQEQSKKAREILASKTTASSQSGSTNIIIEGQIFKGLLPTRHTYRNFDIKTEPVNK
jgi:uncharacterized RDD family membrane protein YckC